MTAPRLVPIDDRFAFEVTGVDAWSILDDATIRHLDDAWSTRGVMVFRRQSITEDELVRLSRRFGEPEIIVRTDGIHR